MRRSLVILCLLVGLATAPIPLRAQGLDPAQGLFVDAFLSIRKAEELDAAGNARDALKTYRAAADALTRLKQSHPNWQPDLVDYRLQRIMESIGKVQGKLGGTAEPEMQPGADPSVLPPLPPIDPLGTDPSATNPPIAEPVVKRGSRKTTPVSSDNADPLEVVKNRIATLEMQLSDSNERLRAEQEKAADLSRDLTKALEERKKADEERKKAADLAQVYQDQLLKVKTSGDRDKARVKELETQLADAKKKNASNEAELAAAEERLSQLVERSRAISAKAAEAAAMPDQVKDLQSRLAQETKAKEEIRGQLAAVTKERDDAKTEIVRLQNLNKRVDQLMADNATLLTKLGEAEKQILTFRTEGRAKDEQIATLKKQVTDATSALTAAEARNAELSSEINTLKTKLDDYSKQVAQLKTDGTKSVEERRRMEQENELLQGIVMRVLREDANRAQRKRMVQKELDRLQIQSDALLRQINYLTEPVVKLSNAERRLFKKPILDVQDPNTLVLVKPSTDPAASAPNPAPTETTPATNPPANPLPTQLETPKPTATPSQQETPKPIETAKLDKPLPMPKEPTKPPGDAASPTVANQPPTRTLPAEIKALAEEAKQAFEREKYPDAERLYDRALQAAPNNLYLLSNKAVVQFRAGKFKQSEETFRKALAIAPEDHFSWCTLGIVQYSQNKFDEAVNSLTKSLAINPKNPTAHNYLGITAAQKGWLEAAEKELQTAIQLDPKYADAWFNLAVTHTLRTPPNKEEARKSYKRALELGAEADAAMEESLK